MMLRGDLYLLLMFVFLSVRIYAVSEEFKYKVVAPEYICSKENLSQTSIRITGEDVPKLNFTWNVTFDIQSKTLLQRHVLLVWQSVRKLNEILQQPPENDLNKGVININNSMLTPDVKYKIQLSAQKQENNKTLTDNKELIIEYVSKYSKKSAMTASVKGPEITYADMPYVAEAEVTCCSENPDYKLTWQLLDKSKKIIKEDTANSRILQLPPGTLTSGKEFMINCLVIDNKSKKKKTSNPLKIKVLERGMKLKTYTKYLKIGLNQAIYINAFFNDPDGRKGELSFVWKCTNSQTEVPCPDFESSNSTELHLQEGFAKTGRYTFTLEAKKGTNTITDQSIIEVVDEMVPIIEVENAMTSCNPSDTLKISAHVNRLVGGCTLQWSSINTEGYQIIDLEKIPGEPGKILTLPEEELSSLEQEELEENEGQVFVDKQYDLVITPSKNGLQPNSKYLFRLTASCPCAEEEIENSSNSSDVTSTTNDPSKQKFVISSVDIIVTTNALPVLKQLKVSPKSGQALKTAFTFRTKKPENCSIPLLYKYGIITNNKQIFVVQQYDSTNIETLLPFHEEPIQTVLEVCDSKNACNLTLGPKVIVKFPNNFTAIEIDVLLNNFNKSVIEQDYYKAFTLSSMLLQTVGNMDNKEQFNRIQETITNITRHEMQHFLNATGDTWLYSAGCFLKSLKMVDSQVQLPQDVLNDILALRDKISETQTTLRKKQNKLEKLKERPVVKTRKLLSLQMTNNKKSKRIVNDINIENIKDYLEISELAIKRLTDFERVETEKQKLKEKLQQYIPRICQFLYNNYKTNLQIELSTIVFEVEKINLVRKYNEFIYIPYEINLHGKIQIGRELAEKYRRQNGVCIGKILFLEDYYNIPQYVYDIKLYTALSNHYLDTEINSFGITIEMPVKSFATNEETYQCVLRENNQWDMTKCRTTEESRQTVRCACKNMGIFSVIAIERTTTVNAGSNTLKTTSTNPDQVTQENNANVAVTTVLTTKPYIVTTENYEFHVYTTTQKQFIQTEAQTQTQIQTQQTVLETTQYTTDETVEEKNNYKTLSPNTNVHTAAVWSISFLSLGIGVLIVAFCILMRKMQRSKAVQSFQTVEYAEYFDEQNLE